MMCMNGEYLANVGNSFFACVLTNTRNVLPFIYRHSTQMYVVCYSTIANNNSTI